MKRPALFKRINRAEISLQSQIYALFVLFLLCTILVTFVSVSSYSGMQQQNLDNYLKLYSSQLASTVKQNYESYENISYSVAYNQVIQNYLIETDPAAKYDAYQAAEKQIVSMENLNPYLVDIAAISKDGTTSIALSGSPSVYQVYEETIRSASTTCHSEGTLTINGQLCHILSMPIHQLTSYGSNSYLGTLFLAVNVAGLFENGLAMDSAYDPLIFLEDESGRLIYGEGTLFPVLAADPETDVATYTVSSENTRYAARTYPIGSTGYRLYVLFDSAHYTGQAHQIARRQIFCMALLFLIIMFLFFLFHAPLIASLHQITAVMKKITKGERKALKQGVSMEDQKPGCLEIAEITDAFNEMLAESNSLNHTIFNTYTQMYELEMMQRRTEIAYLRSQINPHFLYNTLTVICGMASAGMTDQIIDITNALSCIFRYSIKGLDMVTLEQELDIVKSYLLIQKARFEDRFSIRYEIDPDSLTIEIPKMIIQPIVENAIVHGLEKSLKKGELLIGSGFSSDRKELAIWIYDTGVGMSQEQLTKLRNIIAHSMENTSKDAQQNLQNLDAQRHESIGLLNVNSRMVLYYGANYSLIIDSEEGIGTNVQLRIPCAGSQETDLPYHNHAL